MHPLLRARSRRRRARIAKLSDTPKRLRPPTVFSARRATFSCRYHLTASETVAHVSRLQVESLTFLAPSRLPPLAQVIHLAFCGSLRKFFAYRHKIKCVPPRNVGNHSGASKSPSRARTREGSPSRSSFQGPSGTDAHLSGSLPRRSYCTRCCVPVVVKNGILYVVQGPSPHSLAHPHGRSRKWVYCRPAGCRCSRSPHQQSR